MGKGHFVLLPSDSLFRFTAVPKIEKGNSCYSRQNDTLVNAGYIKLNGH